MPETAPPETARDYTLAAARKLTDDMDAYNSMSLDARLVAVATGQFSLAGWAGRATAVLKELTRDA